MQTVAVIHSLLRWFIVLFALWTIFSAISGLMNKSPYSKSANLSNLLFMVFMDMQVVFGFILYFNNGWFNMLKHLGDHMKNTMERFFTLEHWLLMIIAWVLVHAGRTAVKKADTPHKKYKKTLIYFGIAFLLILIAIPWPFREELGRQWFRWF